VTEGPVEGADGWSADAPLRAELWAGLVHPVAPAGEVDVPDVDAQRP
jgi:hypothetical protein